MVFTLKTAPVIVRRKRVKANESPHAYLPSDSSLDFSGVDCMTLDIHLPSRLSLGRRRLTTEVEGACLCPTTGRGRTSFANVARQNANSGDSISLTIY